MTRTFAGANGVRTLSLRDGSGLSRVDGLTPSGIASLLVSPRGKPWFPTWYESLPVAGQADRLVGGTLRSRMRGTHAAGNVHAKTGSLTGVTALSGYVTSAEGEPLVFSILTSGYLSESPKDLEDRIAVRLAQFTRSSPVDAAAGKRRGLADPGRTGPDFSRPGRTGPGRNRPGFTGAGFTRAVFTGASLTGAGFNRPGLTGRWPRMLLAQARTVLTSARPPDEFEARVQ